MYRCRVSRSPRLSLLIAVAASAFLAGCATKNGPTTTGSIGGSRGFSSPFASKKEDPSVHAAIAQSRSLRAAGQKDQAISVLSKAIARNSNSSALQAAYGRALADAGRNDEALAALAKADDPKRPDWRILNSEGAILDQLGRMDRRRRSTPRPFSWRQTSRQSCPISASRRPCRNARPKLSKRSAVPSRVRARRRRCART